jgi:hypothetical protein
MLTSFGLDVKPRSSLCHTHSIIHGLKRSRRSCPRRVSAGYKKTLYQACTFLEDEMWPPKRWEIESGHIRISSWVQGERRRRRRININGNLIVPKGWLIGAERRVCYSGNIALPADSQPKRALTYCYLSQPTANQNEESAHCRCWGSILRPSARQRTALTTRPTLAKIIP